MAREYFLAYHSYLEMFEDLSDTEIGRLFKAVLKYSATKEVSDLRGNEKFLFKVLKIQIDRDSQKYEEKCETNKRNGALGGKTKNERQILANGSERFLNLAVAPKEKKKEKENTKTNIKESIANAIQKKKLGEFKNVLLTEQEFEKLNSEYGHELSGIIEHLSAYIEMKGYKAKSHYLAIKKWVALAYQEQKLRESNFENRKNQNYGGIANAAGIKQDYSENTVCTEFSEGDEPPDGIYN